MMDVFRRWPTTRSYWIVSGLVFLLLLILATCTPSPEQDLPFDTRSARSMEDLYVGSKACRSCHEAEYNDWLDSHHDLAMDSAHEGSVKGDFSGISFTSKGISSFFFRNNDGFFVRTEGPDGELEDFRVDYTFGTEPLQQYLVSFPGGRLQALHLAWDTEKEAWFDLQPSDSIPTDDWMHWTKGSMTWNSMCADCHSTYLEKNYHEGNDSYSTTWAIIDVSCEACHGPGEAHILAAESDEYDTSKPHLFQTASWSSVQQVEACAPCHSLRAERSNVFDHEGALMDHYIPEVLRVPQYFADGQILGEDYVYGSFVQSKMYANGVRCTNCHNPHSLELHLDGNGLCTQCHVASDYDSPDHHFHQLDNEGSSCIHCHMPGQVYMGNDFRRDHSFRVPRPDLSVEYDVPNSCTQCHEGKSNQWAADWVSNWYGPDRAEHWSEILAAGHQGRQTAMPVLNRMMSDTLTPDMVKATILWIFEQRPAAEFLPTLSSSLNHHNPLVRYAAISATDVFPPEQKAQLLIPLLQDSVATVRAQAAYALADVPQTYFSPEQMNRFREVSQEYLDAIALQVDMPGNRVLRGQFYHKRGLLSQAENDYRAAMRIDPYLPGPVQNLARLCYQQQRFEEAEALYRQAIELQPENAGIWYDLGLLLAERQKMNAAAEALGMAAGIGQVSRFYYNWGLALQRLGRRDEAEEAFLQGLIIEPGSEAILYALGVLYVQDGRYAEARPMIEKLLQINPANPQYQQLLRASTN